MSSLISKEKLIDFYINTKLSQQDVSNILVGLEALIATRGSQGRFHSGK